MLGKKFGRLTILKDSGKRTFRNIIWTCKCDCGNVVEVRGSSMYNGSTTSCGCYQREVSRLNMLNENNPSWSDCPELPAIHRWVEARKPKPKVCERCNTNPPYDLANISQEYKRDINDFEWLCRKCHMTKDGRLNRRSVDGTFIGINYA